MKVTTTDPARFFHALTSQFGDEVSQLLDNVTGEVRRESSTWTPAMDVQETEADYRLHLDLPGVDPEQVEIELDEDVLTIAGHRDGVAEIDGEVRRRTERPAGRFRRVLRMPETVDRDAVSADYRDGVLRIQVPKVAKPSAKRIKIGTAADVTASESHSAAE